LDIGAGYIDPSRHVWVKTALIEIDAMLVESVREGLALIQRSAID